LKAEIVFGPKKLKVEMGAEIEVHMEAFRGAEDFLDGINEIMGKLTGLKAEI